MQLDSEIGITGGCQCGAVRYRLTGAPRMLYVCHCSDCQKQSSSAFGMSLIIERKSVEFTCGGERLRSWDTRGDDGEIKRCTFCPDCGTRVYHVTPGEDEPLSIKAGTLDDTPRPRAGRAYLALQRTALGGGRSRAFPLFRPRSRRQGRARTPLARAQCLTAKPGPTCCCSISAACWSSSVRTRCRPNTQSRSTALSDPAARIDSKRARSTARPSPAGSSTIFSLDADANALLEHFRLWPTAPFPGVLDLLNRLRPHFGVAILSNTNELHWQRFDREFGLLDCCDRAFASHLIGLMKPEAGIFSHVSEALATAPGKILFLDDNAANIAAARAGGMQAERVRGPDGVIQALATRGIVDASGEVLAADGRRQQA